MSLIKNDIPILEYDTNSEAVIMAGHSTDFKFPERAVMLFMEKEIDDYVTTNECKIIGHFVSITKIFPWFILGFLAMSVVASFISIPTTPYSFISSSG